MHSSGKWYCNKDYYEILLNHITLGERCVIETRKFIFFFFLSVYWEDFYFLFQQDRIKKPSLSKILSKIPKNDQLILEDFFQDLITRRCEFGYVLFGNKPVSITGYLNPLSDFFKIYVLDSYNLKFQKGMECWRKYYKLFPSKDYLFIFFGEPSSKEDYIDIVLVNNKKLLEVTQKNLTKFQAIFGPNFTAKKLLKKIATEQDFWEEHFTSEMLGILLGYGEANSYFFQRRDDVNPEREGGRFTLKKRTQTPRAGYATVEEEYADLQAKLQLLSDDHPLDEGYMQMPGFMAIAELEETIRIKDEYCRQRRNIIKIFQGGDFFKKSMLRYMGIESEE